MPAKVGIVLLAEAGHDKPVHVPHGRKPHDIPGAPGLFHQHELPAALNFGGQRIQRGRDEPVAQRMPRVFRMIVDEHADDPRAVPGQQNARHAGDILPLFEQRRHAPHRLVRDLVRFSVDHVGNGCRAQAKLLRNVTDAHTLLHPIASFCRYFICSARRSQRRRRQKHAIPEKDTCVLRRFRI